MESPKIDHERTCATPGMPFITVSSNAALLLDLLGGDPGPLRNDVDVVVGDVGVRFDRQSMEGDRRPTQTGVFRSRAPENGSGARSRRSFGSLLLQETDPSPVLRMSATTRCPGATPDSTTGLLGPGNISAAFILDPAELMATGGHEDPLAVVQVQNGCSGHTVACRLAAAALQRRGDEDAEAQNVAGVRNLNAHFRVWMLGLSNCSMSLTRAGQHLIGILVHAEFSLSAGCAPAADRSLRCRSRSSHRRSATAKTLMPPAAADQCPRGPRWSRSAR